MLKMWAYFGEIEIVRIVDLLVLVRCVCVRACVRECVCVCAFLRPSSLIIYH